MYIESVPNRGSPPAILLRESFRGDGRVRKRTLANLSAWPTQLVEGFRTLLKGGVAVAVDGIRARRALPHGHAAAVLGTMRAIGLDRLLGKPADKRLAPLAIALIASRLISPTSKLATGRELAADTAASSLGRLLGLGAVDEIELYRALDWLGARQSAIETALARRHLADGALVLYDLSSSWFEGQCCELARFGYSRDGKKGKLQIVYGLLCAADGCPVAVEVFEGNTADPMTLAGQIDKLKGRFGLSRVVLVGDRGMITSARIRHELKPAGLDWITALRAPQIRALLDTGAFQLSLFDERDLAEITAPEFPGERLVVCKNPLLAEERARKREDLLQATEAALAKLADQIARGTGARGQDQIARAVGRIENRYTRQAVRPRRCRRRLQLCPEYRPHRRRSPARRFLRHSHQRCGQSPGGRSCRRRLQGPRPCRARLSQPEDRRSAPPPDLPLARPAGARSCLSVHARLPRRMAHARAP